MDFDDSFFEDDEDDIKKKEDRRKKANEKITYYPKICEPEWFVTVEADKYDDKQDSEQILKHQADWLFMKKQFEAALEKYQQLLTTVTIPIIIHQVTASIARCHVNLKQWDEALDYTKRSLHPPHDKDTSQLVLLEQILSNQGDDYAALQALQEAVCQQRYNYQLWMALSRVCVSLSTTLRSAEEHKNCENGKGHIEAYFKEPSVDVVKKAITLMKPHFTVRHIKEEMKSETVLRTATAATAATSDGMLWIIDVLAMAVTDDSKQWCVIKLADNQIFHHFLMILSCGSCLWARSILTYCQRHSSSFHLSKVSADMDEIQVMLSNHPQPVIMRMSQCVVEVYDGTVGME